MLRCRINAYNLTNTYWRDGVTKKGQRVWRRTPGSGGGRESFFSFNNNKVYYIFWRISVLMIKNTVGFNFDFINPQQRAWITNYNSNLMCTSIRTWKCFLCISQILKVGYIIIYYQTMSNGFTQNTMLWNYFYIMLATSKLVSTKLYECI